jgi:hypothetical protein
MKRYIYILKKNLPVHTQRLTNEERKEKNRAALPLKTPHVLCLEQNKTKQAVCWGGKKKDCARKRLPEHQEIKALIYNLSFLFIIIINMSGYTHLFTNVMDYKVRVNDHVNF